MSQFALSRYLTLSIMGIITSTIVYADSRGSASNPWSGLYLGFNFGGTFENVTLHAQQIGFQNLVGICNSSFDLSSVYPGVQLGWTKQLKNSWVIGLAGNYNFPSDRHRVDCICALKSNIEDHFDISNNMQASVLGRIGYSLNNNLLPYVSTGVAFSRQKLHYNNESASYPYTKSSTEPGWQIGGGLEWGFASNWSLSAEYYYTYYSSLTMGLPVVYGLADPDGYACLKLRANNVQASIKYWFD